MKHLLKSLFVACCIALASNAAPAQSTAPASGDPLFAALGGKPGLELLMDDFVPRLAADPKPWVPGALGWPLASLTPPSR